MRREELAHLLRSAATISRDPQILVVGSQAILGSHHEDELPEDAWLSIEADLAYFDDPDQLKAIAVDSEIGEDSRFHQEHQYYAQGVDVTVAALPDGWRARIVRFDDSSAAPAQAYCLEKHDLVVAKLVAGREKDSGFAMALIEADLVDPQVLLVRLRLLPEEYGVQRERAIRWLEAACIKLGRGWR